MSLKIDSDLQRFKDIIRNKVKNNLGKFINSSDLTGSVAGKLIKIPLKNIDVPRFTYGSRGAGGMGMGDDGDFFGNQKGKKSGKGEAGDDEGEHGFSAEFTPDELAQILAEELQLPRIENKGKKEVDQIKDRYTSVSREGVILHRKRTFKESLKRSIVSGTYNYDAPFVSPIKSDKRYKTSETKPEPEASVIVIYTRDYSGSMDADMCKRILSTTFWTSLWLKHNYGDLEERFIAFDTKAVELSREEFFSQSSGGGTYVSTGMEKIAEIIEQNKEKNCYSMLFSDGDNSGFDNSKSMAILIETILPAVNLFCYGQVEQNHPGDFLNVLRENVKNEKYIDAVMARDDDVMSAIKTFLGTGK